MMCTDMDNNEIISITNQLKFYNSKYKNTELWLSIS